jgi:hypothetical protein
LPDEDNRYRSRNRNNQAIAIGFRLAPAWHTTAGANKLVAVHRGFAIRATGSGSFVHFGLGIRLVMIVLVYLASVNIRFRDPWQPNKGTAFTV